MEHHHPPPLISFEQNQALQCAEYVEFLSEDSQSCEAHDIGKRNRGVVEPQSSRKKEKRDTGVILKGVMVTSESRISCGQHVQFQLLLDSGDLKGKFSLKSLSAKEEDKLFDGRQVIIYSIIPEKPSNQRYFLGIELWFKQLKDSSETRIDDFCPNCKVSKKGTKKKLLAVRDEKITGIFGEKLVLDVQINEQCSHYVEKFGGPAKSEFFLNTIVYFEDTNQTLTPAHTKLSTGILVIAAGKADATGKKAEKSAQAMKVFKEIALKFEESMRQLHCKVDLMDQRLQCVEATLQAITVPKMEVTESKSSLLTNSQEFKFQKFGSCLSPSAPNLNTSPTTTTTVFSLLHTENSNAFTGNEQILAENSFSAQLFQENSNNKSVVPCVVKPDPELINFHSNQGSLGWAEHFPQNSNHFANPSL